MVGGQDDRPACRRLAPREAGPSSTEETQEAGNPAHIATPHIRVKLSGSCDVPHTQPGWCLSELLEALGLGDEIKRAGEVEDRVQVQAQGQA